MDYPIKNKLQIRFSNHPNLVGSLEYLKNNSFLCKHSNPTFGVEEVPFRIANITVEVISLNFATFIKRSSYNFLKR